MKVNEARRVQAMVRKMTQTRHQDEADAIMAQLSRLAAKHGMSHDKLTAEAEAIMALLPEGARRGDGPDMPSEPPRPDLRPRRVRPVDYWKIGRDMPEWQKSLILVALVAVIFAVIALGNRNEAPLPPAPVTPEVPAPAKDDFS